MERKLMDLESNALKVDAKRALDRPVGGKAGSANTVEQHKAAVLQHLSRARDIVSEEPELKLSKLSERQLIGAADSFVANHENSQQQEVLGVCRELRRRLQAYGSALLTSSNESFKANGVTDQSVNDLLKGLKCFGLSDGHLSKLGNCVEDNRYRSIANAAELKALSDRLIKDCADSGEIPSIINGLCDFVSYRATRVGFLRGEELSRELGQNIACLSLVQTLAETTYVGGSPNKILTDCKLARIYDQLAENANDPSDRNRQMYYTAHSMYESALKGLKSVKDSHPGVKNIDRQRLAIYDELLLSQKHLQDYTTELADTYGVSHYSFAIEEGQKLICKTAELRKQLFFEMQK